jgi:hypothetical protein
MRVLKCIFGGFMLLLGLAGCAVSLLAIMDPVGAKMADDGDPFGAPPSLVSSFFVLVMFVSISALGAYLLWTRRSSRMAIRGDA